MSGSYKHRKGPQGTARDLENTAACLKHVGTRDDAGTVLQAETPAETSGQRRRDSRIAVLLSN